MTDATRSPDTLNALKAQLDRACTILASHELWHEAAKIQQDVSDQKARRKLQRRDLGIGRDPAEQGTKS